MISILTLGHAGFFGSLVSLAIFILMVVCIVDVLRSDLSTFAKVLWVLGLIFFPLVGSLIYLFVYKM